MEEIQKLKERQEALEENFNALLEILRDANIKKTINNELDSLQIDNDDFDDNEDIEDNEEKENDDEIDL